MPKFTELNGTHNVQTTLGSVRFRIEGSGLQNVIFMPDAPAMLEHHHDLFVLRPNQFRFISIEPLGTGFSIPNNDFEFSFDQYASNLIEVIDKIGATNSIIAAGCSNAYFAILMANKRPDLVNKLLLWQAPSWEQQVQFVKSWVDPDGSLRILGGPDNYDKNKYAATRWWFEVSGGPSANAEDMICLTHRVFDNGGCQHLAELVHSILMQPPPSFQKIRKKVTILWCESDRTQKNSHPESILELTLNGKIMRWSNAGHLPEVEFPQKMIDLIVSL